MTYVHMYVYIVYIYVFIRRYIKFYKIFFENMFLLLRNLSFYKGCQNKPGFPGKSGFHEKIGILRNRNFPANCDFPATGISRETRISRETEISQKTVMSRENEISRKTGRPTQNRCNYIRLSEKEQRNEACMCDLLGQYTKWPLHNSHIVLVPCYFSIYYFELFYRFNTIHLITTTIARVLQCQNQLYI